MRIESIKIQGFKSFLQETELRFQQGIIGVVGPNGCGKSNLVDAIRWAIGEQSPKRIRAKHMEEILFNGSDQHCPTGMARVCLVFSRENGGLPEPYSHLHELSVERIYYRSGESEYRINRMPVRLKDIFELFMDTGSGAKAYSIIEQGYIGDIISSNAEQRRMFIEEAAGIVKYKTRKNSALRKMEATRENLRHVEAIVSEINRQMNSLKRQAQKARRYYEIKQKIKKFECYIALREHQEVSEQLNKEKTMKGERLVTETSLRTITTRGEAEIEEMYLRTTDWTKQIDNVQQKTTSLSQELNKKDNEQIYLKRSLEDLERRTSEEANQIQDAQRQLESLVEEKNILGRKLHELLKRNSWLQEMFQEMQNDNESYSLKEKEFHRALEEGRNELFGCLTRLAELKNRQTGAAEKRKDLESRGGKGQKEIACLTEDISSLEAALAKLEIDKDSLLMDRNFTQIERSVHELYQSELEEECNEQLGAVESSQETLHKRTSRLESLLELQQNYEGCQEGVRAIMRRKTSQESVGTGILGMVADVLETSSEYETALESVLGERLQYIIIERQRDGLEAIDYLKTCTIGRSSFIPLHSKVSLQAHAYANEDGECESLIDHVKVKEGYKDIAHYLLGDVCLVPDLDAAITLWENNGISNTLVTRDGEIIDPYGVITGGRLNGSGAGIFKNRREIANLEAQVAGVQLEYERKREGYERSLWKTRLAEADLEKLIRFNYDVDMEILRKEKDIQKIQEVLRINKERLRILCFESEQFEKEIQRLSHALDTYTEKRGQLEREKEEKESSVTSLSRSYSDFLIDKELHTESWNKLEMDVRQLEENIRQKKIHLETINGQMLEITGLMEDRSTKMKDIECQKNVMRIKIEENDFRINRLTEIRMKEEKNLVQLRDVLRKERESLETREETIKKTRKELELILEEARLKDLKIAELEMKGKNICDRIWEKYQIQLDREVAKDRNEQDEPVSREQIRDELESSHRELEKLGEVNPNAIGEFDELNTRYRFYKEQHEDLSNALDSLQKLIQRINRITKRRFLEAFEGINDRFQKMFPKLFGGGKATLELVDSSNLLETGVEIIAQPPGKKLQNVNLLSGGEKALAAIALIFAIFRYKPSPFCILDEVDAALDDVNIHRFNDLIKEMESTSQLVLITHNKQTMEIAGTLFGVVMESPGVSKIVSVRIQ